MGWAQILIEPIGMNAFEMCECIDCLGCSWCVCVIGSCATKYIKRNVLPLQITSTNKCNETKKRGHTLGLASTHELNVY